MKLARSKATRKRINELHKSLSKYQHRAGQTKLKDIGRQQKATTHSGIEIKTQKGTHYGRRGLTLKVNPGGFGAIVKRMPYVGSRETWGEEMHRMYGGVHMAQDRASVNKSMRILLGRRRKKRKIKKAEGGEIVIGNNVDRSLL